MNSPTFVDLLALDGTFFLVLFLLSIFVIPLMWILMWLSPFYIIIADSVQDAWFTWTSKVWYQYLLAPKHKEVSWITAILCRAKGHPYGVVWYNVSGVEPDMHCNRCHDDLS